jgi:hypothetical protein
MSFLLQVALVDLTKNLIDGFADIMIVLLVKAASHRAEMLTLTERMDRQVAIAESHNAGAAIVAVVLLAASN